MINILRKQDCVGCSSCLQKCPVSCITMTSDTQGFQYPQVDRHRCIDCGLCEKVCPVINAGSSCKSNQVYAAWNTDDKVRISSSSGGVFYSLAKNVIEHGGVVFGVRFNDKWEVIHDYVEDVDKIHIFQGSKYVQSQIGNCFILVKQFLKSGRQVLFSGTPCQVAGLKLFLNEKWESKLITVDFICHGVPSPKVWDSYLKYVIGSELDYSTASRTISNISFRDKRNGWIKYGLSITKICKMAQSRFSRQIENESESEIFYEYACSNVFMQCFLRNFTIRQSCFKCPAKRGRSNSDITLADFWDVQKYYPELYSHKGVSLLLVNSAKGNMLLESTGITMVEVDNDVISKINPSYIKSAEKPHYYSKFWELFETDGIRGAIFFLNHIKPPVLKRVYRNIKILICKLIRR